MPGIVGLITSNPDRELATARLSTMLASMRHDSSYVHGTYARPERGCYLGWVSHAGSFSDCNPIVGEKGDCALIFAGEHYSHETPAGPATTGARCLLSMYERSGERFVETLNGWFAGVLVDRAHDSILLFNDRFGVHRVYVHEGSDTFLFASEAKAILGVCPETQALDPESVGHFLGFGTVFDNRTLFTGISLLPGGSAWRIGGQVPVRKRKYFDPTAWAAQPQLAPAAFYSKLRETVSRVVPSYFRSPTPVGLSLTGGLDTRIVMAGMPSDAGSMPSYTYGGVYRDCYDIHVAREVAAACGQSHAVIPLGSDFFRNFESYAEQTVWLTDGTLDLCGSHEVYYSGRARQFSPVRLTGNYGSEVLRSVSTFKYNPPNPRLFDPAAVASTARAAETFAGLRSAHPVTFAAFTEIPWNLFGRLAAAQTQLVLRSPYMDNELVALLYQAPPHTRDTNQTSVRLIADLNPRLAAIPTDMAYGGHAPAPLARARQLHRYLQFKAEWYYNVGMPDWFLRFDNTPPVKMLEPLFLGSHKVDHYRLWFRDQLNDYLTSLLSDTASRLRPYLNPREYGAFVTARRKGGYTGMNEINRIATLELVQRLLVERSPR